MRILLRSLVLAALFFPAVLARAQDPQRHTWDIGLWVAGATGEESTNSFAEAQIVSAGVSLGLALTPEIGSGWRRGRLVYLLDVAPAFIQVRPKTISGIAFDPVVLRWNSSVHRGRVTPFVELGGGGVHTNVNFPQSDTSTFNFIARGGGGILISARRTQALEIACRWWHISNANLGTRNPEFNGIQVSLGWHWLK